MFLKRKQNQNGEMRPGIDSRYTTPILKRRKTASQSQMTTVMPDSGNLKNMKERSLLSSQSLTDLYHHFDVITDFTCNDNDEQISNSLDWLIARFHSHKTELLASFLANSDVLSSLALLLERDCTNKVKHATLILINLIVGRDMPEQTFSDIMDSFDSFILLTNLRKLLGQGHEPPEQPNILEQVIWIIRNIILSEDVKYRILASDVNIVIKTRKVLDNVSYCALGEAARSRAIDVISICCASDASLPVFAIDSIYDVWIMAYQDPSFTTLETLNNVTKRIKMMMHSSCFNMYADQIRIFYCGLVPVLCQALLSDQTKVDMKVDILNLFCSVMCTCPGKLVYRLFIEYNVVTTLQQLITNRLPLVVCAVCKCFRRFCIAYDKCKQCRIDDIYYDAERGRVFYRSHDLMRSLADIASNVSTCTVVLKDIIYTMHIVLESVTSTHEVMTLIQFGYLNTMLFVLTDQLTMQSINANRIIMTYALKGVQSVIKRLNAYNAITELLTVHSILQDYNIWEKITKSIISNKESSTSTRKEALILINLQGQQ